jgi:tetratricopeptide (TPR) repeat protein
MAIGQTLDPHDLPPEEADRKKLARELAAEADQALRSSQPLVWSLKMADALMLDPNERGLLSQLDQVIFTAPDPLSLFPVATGAIHVATAAARARVLMIQKRLPEAIDLLGAVLEVAPELEYLDWVRRWLQPHIIPQLGLERLMGAIVKPALSMVLGVPVPPSPRDRRLANVRSLAEILVAMQACFAEEKIVWLGAAMCRRRLGDTTATLAAAEEGVRRFPQDWGLRTVLLNALRDAGRPDEALAQARTAMQIDPGDLSPLHDAAHGFLSAGRPADAANLFQELLSREPRYPGADACLLAARYQATGRNEDRHGLLLLRERRWWDDGVQAMADAIDPPVPYFTALPGPGDAAAAYGREMASELAEVLRCCGRGASIGVTIQSRWPESPSAALAFDVTMRALGAGGAELGVEVERAQQPDPRADKGRVPFPVFALQNGALRPLATQADPSVAHAVGSVAFQLFRRDVWDPMAQQVAAQLGPSAVTQVMAVLTAPPAPPPDFDGITWMYRCQMAAALILSHLGFWESGPGRAALYSLISGPSDWVTSAGIVALAWRALDAPQVRAEVEGVFRWLRSLIPQEGYTPWEHALAASWLGMGGHPDAVAAELAAWLERYDATVESKNVVRTLRRYGGMTLEEYAAFSVERDRIVSGLGYRGAGAMLVGFNPPPALVALCQKARLDPRRPFVDEWQEAINASPRLQAAFVEARHAYELEKMGVSGDEKAALDQIRGGEMDMHLRMAQAQEAQRAVQQGDAGDPDPVVFPGQRVARLSDYVRILKGMQSGNMMGALQPYGLDIMSYASVAQAWAAKMAADPVLTEKFSRMMQG